MSGFYIITEDDDEIITEDSAFSIVTEDFIEEPSVNIQTGGAAGGTGRGRRLYRKQREPNPEYAEKLLDEIIGKIEEVVEEVEEAAKEAEVAVPIPVHIPIADPPAPTIVVNEQALRLIDAVNELIKNIDDEEVRELVRAEAQEELDIQLAEAEERVREEEEDEEFAIMLSLTH